MPSECADHRYAPGHLAVENLPNSQMADRAAVEQGLPAMSVAVESCHLRRLYERPQARGREWEIPAYATYFDNGTARFGATIGLRRTPADRRRPGPTIRRPTARRSSGTSSRP
ncbi:MAG: hypothetical protein VYE73_01985 [Acidobacteriota bacterium]|nr:hypothetical protein [Acidobacteriota bacterium]